MTSETVAPLRRGRAWLPALGIRTRILVGFVLVLVLATIGSVIVARAVLSRQQLLSHVWGYDVEPGPNVVDVYVGYLRRKLGKELIASVRGMGYRLESPVDPGARA